MSYPRTVGLSLRGFDAPVADVVAAIGTVPSLTGSKGQPLKEGYRPLIKSVVCYELPMSHETRWSEAIDALLNSLGDLDTLKAVIETFRPETVHINLVLPIRNSEEQEDNYITPETMARLVALDASVGCSFV
jgi:hypothetical protein